MLLAFVLLGRAMEARAKVGEQSVHLGLQLPSHCTVVLGQCLSCTRDATAAVALTFVGYVEHAAVLANFFWAGYQVVVSPADHGVFVLWYFVGQVRAASDLKALARLIPTEARLVLDPGAEPGAPAAGGSSSDVEYALVQTSSVRPGDILRVLPGKGVGCAVCACCGKAVRRSGDALLNEVVVRLAGCLIALDFLL